MISLLYTGLKLNSSIQIKFIHFEVFLSDRRKKDWVSWVYSCSTTFCLCFLKLVFKKLYKNSGREIGTLRFFREKLQRRNVTQDVKHYEDCEQLFISVGKCFTIEALVKFFNMTNKDGDPTNNRPPLFHILMMGNNKQVYFNSVLDKFIDEFLLLPSASFPGPPREEENQENEVESFDNTDFVNNYSSCLMKYFMILLDIKDAVREGNGETLATLHKVLLPYFKSLPGFNAYAIEMLISVIQNEVFLSEAEAHHCMWASTANWKGGVAKNIEIDLLQENRNKDIKKAIKAMGPNKTDNAIDRSSRASGGERLTVQNFDHQVGKTNPTSSLSHKSFEIDERIVLRDLHDLKPFDSIPNRKYDSFQDISANPMATLDQVDLDKWLKKHKRNLMLDAPLMQDEEDEL